MIFYLIIPSAVPWPPVAKAPVLQTVRTPPFVQTNCHCDSPIHHDFIFYLYYSERHTTKCTLDSDAAHLSVDTLSNVITGFALKVQNYLFYV